MYPKQEETKLLTANGTNGTSSGSPLLQQACMALPVGKSVCRYLFLFSLLGHGL